MAEQNSPEPPEFIQFLFSDKPKFDCFFIVGEKSLVEPERIGAVKLMLMAHSPVFRLELEDSGLREKNDVPLKDMYPDTFRNVLKYMYGYDIIGDLEFNEADNMFYVAEKYMMPRLKNKLALRLTTLLTPENVCSLLNNPACRDQLELNSHITQILRYETDKVLASPQFLEVCAEGFITMLEQDGLTVAEIELWRAAVKWAKHKVDSEDGQVLRQQLSGISEHLRICTLNYEQFWNEVTPTKILNNNELLLVAESIGKKEKIEETIMFNNKLEPRKRLCKDIRQCKRFKSDSSVQELKLTNLSGEECNSQCNFDIRTKQSAVELLPLVCMTPKRERMDPPGWLWRVNGTVKIRKYTGPDSYHITDPLTKFTFCKEVEYGQKFEVPFTNDGYNVVLLPNSKYQINVSFAQNVLLSKYEWYPIHENEHLLLECKDRLKFFCSQSLYYRLEDN
ncbi:BTB/POZ domain-containing protein 6-like [Macrosteles quadrilineatus]|uniref:BTB/POZ domain-containing protein 6-like n=1 Tax=Macrosteles quadrilineatus TaxID=74068 RepID=UPI0023E28585|nr:BTB/POZ domain-containing protein 6-like [Macrosteles quadrilineatus]